MTALASRTPAFSSVVRSRTLPTTSFYRVGDRIDDDTVFASIVQHLQDLAANRTEADENDRAATADRESQALEGFEIGLFLGSDKNAARFDDGIQGFRWC